MKKLTFKLLAAILVFSTLASTCDDDNDIDFFDDCFVGTWSRNFNPTNDPNLSVDRSVEYTFNSDRTWSRHDVDFISGRETTINGERYIISDQYDLGSLYVDMADYPHLYANPNNVSFEMIRLNENSMVWKVTKQDANNNLVYETWKFDKKK